jgi:glycosyltransferase involved in cell wall biosynthesis
LAPDVVARSLATALDGVLTAPRSSRRPRAGHKTKPRLAIVVQRYGEQVSGGAERHAREVAPRLAALTDVTVLTTCATDHLSWENALPPGDDRDGGLRVRRFEVARARSIRTFNRLSRARFGQSLDRMQEEHWIAEQGPLVPGLLRHLEEQRARYDAFLFFTYLYAPTVWGLPMVAQRSLLVPTAHDEPPLAFHAYADVFERPRALLCNTPEEEALIRRRFPRHARTRVVGVGIDSRHGQPARFAAKHHLERPYLFYVGRIEQGKGIGELLRHHRFLRAVDGDAPDLVLAGALHMALGGERLRYVGRISDEDKWDALAGALAVVIPSRWESLSLLALEAFAQGTPIVANGESEVLRGQVRRSRAGELYTDSASFAAAVNRVAKRRAQLGRSGRAFAAKHSWDKVLNAYREEIARIVEDSNP